MESGEYDVRNRVLSLVCAASAIAVGGPALSPESASATFGDRTLRTGSHGREVRVLQRWLTKLGVPTHVDGAYGRGTRRSVRAYERRYRLNVDGRVSRAQARGLRKRVQALPRAPAQPAAALTPTAKAVLAADGRTALAPAGAPPEVQSAITAANRIVGKPYRYGGGHGRWEDAGYDCSGTVSYALHGAGLLRSPLDSGAFARWGKAGKGRWITVFANGGHAYAIIAGLRLDTSGSGGSGPRWRKQGRSSRGFTARHPTGF
jgi:hypothetical protein